MSVLTAPIANDSLLFKPINESPDVKEELQKSLIQTSPYLERSHWLDISDYDIQYKLLTIALQSFKSQGDYANNSYVDSFNIKEIIGLVNYYSRSLNIELPDFDVYIVGFRSCLFPEIRQSSEKREILGQVDKASHEEANQSGGLLKYWYGIPNSEGKNLATCWWVSSSHAKFGGRGNNHREGVNLVRNWYQLWEIEQYHLNITKNATDFAVSRIMCG
ncbi:hypothetical protein CLIB1444_09S03884 [[Candida] jaroonii]|uniref:Uncharacterized protein n=1 Tax=[Candida] jaroonii TaxID=467808 RepID=A0ACA9YCY7_9ASCO|nr:hypothetical protein CLIB1444_09S03884 [[Candida] jaroonii]